MTYRLRFRVETPCFCGGAEAATEPCIRAASLRGALRFWLRALSAHHFRAADYALFGSCNLSSSVTLTVDTHRFNAEPSGRFPPEIAYLAYGLTRRKQIPCGSEIKVSVSFSKGADERIKRLFFLSVCGLVVFGGVGARTRRGFGTLSLTAFEPQDESSEVLSWINAGAEGMAEVAERVIQESAELASGFGEPENVLPPVSFASDGAEVYISRQNYGSAEAAHRRLGALMRAFRDYRTSRLARRDHDLIYQFATCGKIDNVPLRTIFGMPHHYFLRNLQNGVTMSVTLTPGATARGITRRASPVLLSVVPTNNGATIAVILMRGTFLPRGVPILVECQRRRQRKVENLPPRSVSRHPSWQAAISFVDNLFRSGEFASLRLVRKEKA